MMCLGLCQVYLGTAPFLVYCFERLPRLADELWLTSKLSNFVTAIQLDLNFEQKR